jgi:hypothetical protein
MDRNSSKKENVAKLTVTEEWESVLSSVLFPLFFWRLTFFTPPPPTKPGGGGGKVHVLLLSRFVISFLLFGLSFNNSQISYLTLSLK